MASAPSIGDESSFFERFAFEHDTCTASAANINYEAEVARVKAQVRRQAAEVLPCEQNRGQGWSALVPRVQADTQRKRSYAQQTVLVGMPLASDKDESRYADEDDNEKEDGSDDGDGYTDESRVSAARKLLCTTPTGGSHEDYDADGQPRLGGTKFIIDMFRGRYIHATALQLQQHIRALCIETLRLQMALDTHPATQHQRFSEEAALRQEVQTTSVGLPRSRPVLTARLENQAWQQALSRRCREPK